MDGHIFVQRKGCMNLECKNTVQKTKIALKNIFYISKTPRIKARYYKDKV